MLPTSLLLPPARATSPLRPAHDLPLHTALYKGRHRPAAAPLLRARGVLAVLVLLATAAFGPAAWSPATAFTWFSTLCTGFTGCNAVGLGNAGYQNVYTQSFFGMYGGHNCTNYVAYRLKSRGINASYMAGQGNGYQWGPVAAAHGVAVDKSPRVGDIAWFDQKAGLSSNGHVAYVEAVDTTTGRVKVSEDNWGGDFDWRWYLVADVTGFIHFGGTVSPTPPPPPTPPGNGTFVRVNENGQVYRIAGGAPIYVSTWAGYGSVQPLTAISAATLAAMPTYPADGTFLTGTDGRVYRVAGGAPLYVSTWASFGGSQPTVVVDAAAIANAGGSGVYGHLLATPRDGSFLRSAADSRTYVVAYGAPMYVPTWAAYGGTKSFVVVDPYELANGPHLRATAGDGFLRGWPSGRLVHVSAGRPLGFSSWTTFGGQKPVVVVDDTTLAGCDHVLCSPFGSLDQIAPVPGGAAVTGWADDPDGTGSTPVRLMVDGVLAATTSTGASRPDVDAVFHHGTSTGYSTTLALTQGTHQVCAVALNGGRGAATVQLGCAPVTVTPGAAVAVTPARLLDTGSGVGVAPGALAAGGTTTVRVTGRGPVPATGVAAVALNVTATEVRTGGYVTVWPAGRPRPSASNLTVAAGRTTADLVLVPVAADGTVSLYNGTGSTLRLLADVTAYVVGGTATSGGTTVSTTSSRLADTRTGQGLTVRGAMTNGSVRTVKVAGLAGVPRTGAAAFLNVTAVTPTADGYVTAYPSGSARPVSANVRFTRGANVTGLVLVPLAPDGSVQLYTSTPGSVHLVVDVAGWILTGTPSTPGATSTGPLARLVDTRLGTGAPAAALGPYGTLTVGAAGRASVPAGAFAAVLSVTATGGSRDGYLSLFPAGSARPGTSNLSYVAGGSVPNLVVVPLGANGSLSIFNGSPGAVHAIVDVVGWVRR